MQVISDVLGTTPHSDGACILCVLDRHSCDLSREAMLRRMLTLLYARTAPLPTDISKELAA